MPEPLDIEQRDILISYLQQHGRIGEEEEPETHILRGGVSNRTVLVQRQDGESWVIKQALGKLRVATDWFSSPERIHREAMGLRWLARLAPAGTITPLIFEDEEQHILAMQAVPQPHDNWKNLLLDGIVKSAHIEQFGRLLGSIHSQAAVRRQEVEPVFADTSFFESLRIEPYYLYTAREEPQAASFLHALVDETRAHRLTLVHGDYSPKNVLVYGEQLILLDHEVIHWGDPAFDLGFSLTHLLSKAHHLREQRDLFADAARLYWNTYCQSQSVVSLPEERAIRQTLGCLLARVSGRSPLEYLDAAERSRQRRVVLALMQQPPTSIEEFIAQFVERIEYDGGN